MSDETYTPADIEDESPLTPERLAEACGARTTLVVRLVRLGVLEATRGAGGEVLLPSRAVIRLRRMQRLRRDLGVNFAGARVILELVEEIERLKRLGRASAPEDFTEA